jgi:hypothetical protein
VKLRRLKCLAVDSWTTTGNIGHEATAYVFVCSVTGSHTTVAAVTRFQAIVSPGTVDRPRLMRMERAVSPHRTRRRLAAALAAAAVVTGPAPLGYADPPPPPDPSAGNAPQPVTGGPTQRPRPHHGVPVIDPPIPRF